MAQTYEAETNKLLSQIAEELGHTVRARRIHIDTPMEKRAYDPYDPFNTDEQMAYWSSWRLLGLEGLTTTLYSVAEKNRGRHPDKSWEYVMKDADTTKIIHPNIIFLLAAIHPELVSSILKGDVSFKKQNDPKFAGMLERTARPTSTPGIYLNVLCRCGYDPDTQAPVESHLLSYKNAGKGLTYAESVTLYNKVILYYDLGGDAAQESLEYAKLVDDQFQGRQDSLNYDEGGRKYNVDRAIIRTFLAPFNVLFERWRLLDKTSQQAMKDVPQMRCLHDIGWSSDVSKRAFDHQSDTGSTAILGLVRSILRIETSDGFRLDAFHVLKSWDPNHAALAEIMMSMISSSYWFTGGLNRAFAGRMSSPHLLGHEYEFDKNGTAVVLDPRVMDKHLQMDMEMLKMNTKVLERANTLKAELAELEKAEEQIAKSAKELTEMSKLMDCAVEMKLFEEQFKDYHEKAKEAVRQAVTKDMKEARKQGKGVVEYSE